MSFYRSPGILFHFHLAGGQKGVNEVEILLLPLSDEIVCYCFLILPAISQRSPRFGKRLETLANIRPTPHTALIDRTQNGRTIMEELWFNLLSVVGLSQLPFLLSTAGRSAGTEDEVLSSAFERTRLTARRGCCTFRFLAVVLRCTRSILSWWVGIDFGRTNESIHGDNPKN